MPQCNAALKKCNLHVTHKQQPDLSATTMMLGTKRGHSPDYSPLCEKNSLGMRVESGGEIWKYRHTTGLGLFQCTVIDRLYCFLSLSPLISTPKREPGGDILLWWIVWKLLLGWVRKRFTVAFPWGHTANVSMPHIHTYLQMRRIMASKTNMTI